MEYPPKSSFLGIGNLASMLRARVLAVPYQADPLKIPIFRSLMPGYPAPSSNVPLLLGPTGPPAIGRKTGLEPKRKVGTGIQQIGQVTSTQRPYTAGATEYGSSPERDNNSDGRPLTSAAHHLFGLRFEKTGADGSLYGSENAPSAFKSPFAKAVTGALAPPLSDCARGWRSTI